MRKAVAVLTLVLATCPRVGAQPQQPPEEILGSLVRASGGIIRERSDAVARINAWVAAVTSHEPGAADTPAQEIAGWSPAALADLEVELVTLHALIVNIRRNVFNLPRAAGDRGYARQVVYSAEDLKALRDLATSVQLHGGERRLLSRGALLHTDIALGIVRPAPAPTVRGTAAPARPDPGEGAKQTTIQFADGREGDRWRTADHWRTARLLLDQLRVDPSVSPDVRAWYGATIAYTQGKEQWNLLHSDQALSRFPGDPDILFLIGCLHEALAGARLQAFLSSAGLPPDFRRARPPKDEYREALDLFRRALDGRSGPRSGFASDAAEIALHYGRMQHLDGRPADAVQTLGRALQSGLTEQLGYYANLFLGSAQEDLDRVDDARKAYERAAALFPAAQSPKLALSALAMRGGDRAAASEAVDTLIMSSQRRDADDPWWTYHTSQALDAEARLADVRERLSKVGTTTGGPEGPPQRVPAERR